MPLFPFVGRAVWVFQNQNSPALTEAAREVFRAIFAAGVFVEAADFHERFAIFNEGFLVVLHYFPLGFARSERSRSISLR